MNTSPISSLLRRPNYTDEFKQKALQQVAKGNSPEQVALSLGISKNSLLRWKSLVQPDSPVPPFIDHPNTANLPGTSPAALADSGDSMNPLDELRADDPPEAASPDPSITSPPGLIDKRRLYSDAFKADIKRQITSGVSIRQLHQALGVSQVTLHKWKKETTSEEAANAGQTALDQPDAEAPTSAPPVVMKATGYTIELVLAQLRTAEAERDILKKALRILLRPD